MVSHTNSHGLTEKNNKNNHNYVKRDLYRYILLGIICHILW